MANTLKVTEVKAQFKLENGTETTLDLNPLQIEAFVRSNGITFKEVDEKSFAFFHFDDKTIQDNVLSLLPKIEG